MRVLLLLCFVISACSFHGTGRPRRAVDGTLRCSEEKALPVFDTVLAVATLGAAVWIVAETRNDDGGPGLAGGLAIPFAVFGAFETASAIYGYRMVSTCRSAMEREREIQQSLAREREERARARGRAWAVTQEAAAAARRGDCTAALKLGEDVRALDAELHETVFTRDRAIAACIALASDVP